MYYFCSLYGSTIVTIRSYIALSNENLFKKNIHLNQLHNMQNIQVGEKSQWWGILCVCVCARERMKYVAGIDCMYSIYNIMINGVMALVLWMPVGKPRGCVSWSVPLWASGPFWNWKILLLDVWMVAEVSCDWSMSASVYTQTLAMPTTLWLFFSKN